MQRYCIEQSVSSSSVTPADSEAQRRSGIPLERLLMHYACSMRGASGTARIFSSCSVSGRKLRIFANRALLALPR